MRYGPICFSLLFLTLFTLIMPITAYSEDQPSEQASEQTTEDNNSDGSTEQKKSPKLKVKMSDEMQAKEDAFSEKFQSLTDEQKAIVSQMELDFMQTTQPDIDILYAANQISKCSYSSTTKNKMIEKKFKQYQDKQNEIQNQMWAEFDRKYKGKVDFMDEKELRHHLYLQFNIATSTAASLIKVKGNNEKPREWCKTGLKTIEVGS